MKTFKKIALKTFVLLVKLLWSRDLGNLPPVRVIYGYLYRILQVHGVGINILQSNYGALSPRLIYDKGYEKCDQPVESDSKFFYSVNERDQKLEPADFTTVTRFYEDISSPQLLL